MNQPEPNPPCHTVTICNRSPFLPPELRTIRHLFSNTGFPMVHGENHERTEFYVHVIVAGPLDRSQQICADLVYFMASRAYITRDTVCVFACRDDQPEPLPPH